MTTLDFHPDRPGCAQELGLGGVPPAPGKHRHAVSDPAETNRKELSVSTVTSLVLQGSSFKVRRLQD